MKIGCWDFEAVFCTFLCVLCEKTLRSLWLNGMAKGKTKERNQRVRRRTAHALRCRETIIVVERAYSLQPV